MFNNKLIIRTIQLVLAVFLLVSCDDGLEGTKYTGDAGFGFPSTVLNVEVGADDSNKILVPVYRGSMDHSTALMKIEYDASKGSSLTPIWVEEDPNKVFSLLTENLTFPDNALSTYAQIRFSDLEKIGITGKYRMRLTILGFTSPSMRNTIVVTVSRKLSFKSLGKCDFMDNCLFFNSYKVEIQKAEEAEIYRLIDPYSQGLTAEDYAANGWTENLPAYVQFSCDADGYITYEPFSTGMKVNGAHLAFAYYPSQYIWGMDFSSYDAQNKKLSDKVFQLYPVYCLPSFQYGYLNEGAYPLVITLE